MPTIALVDDDRNILTSVRSRSKPRATGSLTYTDGASALDGFKTSPPDLAILDIKSPGWTAWRPLRRLRQKSDMPVIFLTSKDEEIDELSASRWAPTTFNPQTVSRSGCWSSAVKAVLRRASPKTPRCEGSRLRQGAGSGIAAHGSRAAHSNSASAKFDAAGASSWFSGSRRSASGSFFRVQRLLGTRTMRTTWLASGRFDERRACDTIAVSAE